MNFTKNTHNVSNTSMPLPCREWAEKLAATHVDDLSLTERTALEQHVATCPACSSVLDEYRAMDDRILGLPAVAPLPTSMVEQEMLEEVSKTQHEAPPATNKPVSPRSPKRLSRTGKMLSTIAAVLVVGFIVGSFLLLFSINRNNDTFWSIGATTGGSAAIYVATDVSKSVAYAINPINGAIIWKHMLGYKLTGPAVVVQKLVIFASYNGSIYAYHKENGALAWQTRVERDVNAAPSLTPVSSSSNAVYFSTMGGNFGALRSSNGSIIWKKHLSTCTQSCDEFGIGVDNGMYYVFADGSYALRADIGSVAWHNATLTVPSKFAVTDGKVFLMQPLKANWESVISKGSADSQMGNILILRGSDGQQLNKIPGYNFAVANDVLYVENGYLQWYAMRVNDGSILWRSKSPGCFEGVLSGSTLYSTTNVIEAGSIQLKGQNVTPTTIQSQSGYSEICAMSTSDGHIRWDWKTRSIESVGTPVEFNGVAYFVHNANLEARSAGDGKVLWVVPMPTTNLQGPTIG